MENKCGLPERTTPVATTTTPLIPYADQARVNVNVKLTSQVYLPDLADETSDAYRNLKTKVVDTVIPCVYGCGLMYV